MSGGKWVVLRRTDHALDGVRVFFRTTLDHDVDYSVMRVLVYTFMYTTVEHYMDHTANHSTSPFYDVFYCFVTRWYQHET